MATPDARNTSARSRLKALRAGAPIGPDKRPGYRLPVNPDDFDTAEEGAAFVRSHCVALGPNVAKKKASTMPEIFGLQFFANESGLRTTASLRPLNLNKAEAKIRFTKMGVDMSSARKGTFDGINTTGEPWVHSRGWGLGQETEGSVADYNGVRLHRGLPVLNPGQTEVRHPTPFVDKTAGFDSVLRRKVLSRFNKHGRRDCTFGEAGGHYYDCHTCLKRFFERGWVGAGKFGAGGVIVPRGEKFFGGPAKAAGFFLDLERVTEFARAGGATEDAAARDEFLLRFKTDVPEADEETLEVMRSPPRAHGAVEISSAVKRVAKARGTDADALKAKVIAYMDARRDLPCTWCHVRIRYAGTGDQAFNSLQKLLHIVGNLEVSSSAAGQLVKRHILEASAERRGEPPPTPEEPTE